MELRPRQCPSAARRAVDGGSSLLEVYERHSSLVARDLLDGHGLLVLDWLLLLLGVVFLLLRIDGWGCHGRLVGLLLLLGILLDRLRVGAI